MPRKCCGLVADYIDAGDIVNTTVYYKGKMHHGASVDFGLGPKLICVYFFEFSDGRKRDELLKKTLKNLETSKLMELA